jgi:hypothetical protein
MPAESAASVPIFRRLAPDGMLHLRDLYFVVLLDQFDTQITLAAV